MSNIGNKNLTSGVPARSAALTTGTKNGTTPYKKPDNQDKSGVNAFSRIYDMRKETDAKRNDAQQQTQDITALIAATNKGDPTATAALLKQLEPTINSAINSMAGNDLRYKTRARMMALDAVKNYDPARGTELSTHVFNRLQGLRRLVADRGNMIHVPEKSALEKRQLEEIKSEYMLENGVEPSLAELADRSGMPLKKVGRLMSIFGTTSTSMTRGESGDSLEHKPRTATELYNDAFYTELPEMDKKIYEWTTGYQGSPQLDRTTIAKRLGVSEAAISQHVKRIDQRAVQFDRMLNDTIYGGQDA